MSRCYHFCSTEFYNELLLKKEIIPIQRDVSNRNNAYEYLFHKINYDNPMFFAWEQLDNRGEAFQYVKKSNIMLLTLDVPENEIIKTNYYNWVDFIYFMELDNGGEKTLSAIKEELGCDFKTLYDCVFRLNDGYKIIQYLIKKLRSEWILDKKYVDHKII